MQVPDVSLAEPGAYVYSLPEWRIKLRAYALQFRAPDPMGDVWPRSSGLNPELFLWQWPGANEARALDWMTYATIGHRPATRTRRLFAAFEAVRLAVQQLDRAGYGEIAERAGPVLRELLSSIAYTPKNELGSLSAASELLADWSRAQREALLAPRRTATGETRLFQLVFYALTKLMDAIDDRLEHSHYDRLTQVVWNAVNVVSDLGETLDAAHARVGYTVRDALLVP